MVVRRSFGGLADGRQASIIELSNDKGERVSVSDFGGTIVAVAVKDRAGAVGDVVLGYENLQGYLTGKAYLGATVGRYANRIANAGFMLDSVAYTLSKNEGNGQLHGGLAGFDKVLWHVVEAPATNGNALTLQYLSKDNEEGYPGNLDVSVTFTWDNDSALRIDYRASTDRATVINLTNHSYFNLKGDGNILDHHLTLYAGHFLPVDAKLIPTGVIESVENSPFDFRRGPAIGSHIHDSNEQLVLARGFDQTWVLDRGGLGPDGLAHAATLYEATSGRQLDVWTTEPGIQFYTGNHLVGTPAGKRGVHYGPQSGLCLETQHFPDSPNHANFPSTVLRPGSVYTSTTVYKFSLA